MGGITEIKSGIDQLLGQIKSPFQSQKNSTQNLKSNPNNQYRHSSGDQLEDDDKKERRKSAPPNVDNVVTVSMNAILL